MIAGGRPCCFVDLPLLIHSLGTTRLPTDNHDLIRDAYSKQASALLWLTVNSCLTVISLSGKSPFFSGGGGECCASFKGREKLIWLVGFLVSKSGIGCYSEVDSCVNICRMFDVQKRTHQLGSWVHVIDRWKIVG